jgi:hypothetical protein
VGCSKNRIVLTHDISTMAPEANQLIVQGEPMAGVIFVPDQLQVGRAISDLEIMIECYSEAEMRNHTRYVRL